MPRYKPSEGRVEIKTPHESFRTFIKDSLENLRQWNPNNIETRGDGYRFRVSFDSAKHKGFSDRQPLWTIGFTPTGFWVESQQPVVYLGANMRVLMGSGKLEIR